MLVTASGHTYVSGATASSAKQMTVYCDQSFTLAGSGIYLFSGSNAFTSQSFSTVNVNTIAGTYVLSFPAVSTASSYEYIYCDTSSFKIRTTNELAAHWNASSSLGSIFSVSNQSKCWTKGIDFTGVGKGPTGPHITLITPLHGITCNHYLPINGEIITFYDTASNPITGGIILSQINLTGTDVQLITFTSPLPATCTPSWVLPTNWNDYIFDVNNTPYEPVLPCIVPNANLGTIEARAWWSFTSVWPYEITVVAAVPNCPVTNNTYYTSGQSGVPVMTLVGGKRVFMYAIHWSTGGGPLISQAPIFNWLTASILPYTMSVVDMSSYQNVF